MDKIEFIFPPTVAMQYVREWRKKAESDKDADPNVVKVLNDVETVMKVGMKHLMTPQDKQTNKKQS